MCWSKFIKPFCLIAYVILVSGCASMSDDSFGDIGKIFTEDSQPNVVPQGPAYGKPVVLVPKHYEHVPNPKPIIKKTIAKPAIKKPLVRMVKNTCTPEKFLSYRTISGLYKSYNQENKGCKILESQKIASAFTGVLAQNFATQDVRLLNADNAFLNLYASAINHSEQADKVALNKQIVSHGCHLLKPDTCSVIKRSLY